MTMLLASGFVPASDKEFSSGIKQKMALPVQQNSSQNPYRGGSNRQQIANSNRRPQQNRPHNVIVTSMPQPDQYNYNQAAMPYYNNNRRYHPYPPQVSKSYISYMTEKVNVFLLKTINNRVTLTIKDQEFH